MSDDEIYNVKSYTDSELLEFLDVHGGATDRELEAKIVQMMNQHPDMKAFFDGIYRRFFQVEDDDDEDDDNDVNASDVVEGFVSNEGVEVLQSKGATDAKTGKLSDKQVADLKKLGENSYAVSTAALVKTDDPRMTQSTVFTKALDYIKDPKNLNPTFQNTMQRVMILDSRCRDRTVYPSSTDFVMTLNTKISNVLALNFYYINVPYTWYTISKAYGANFFYLNGNVPGINDINHAIKFEIPAANYPTTQSLVTAVNDAVTRVKNTRTDINFKSSTVNVDTVSNGQGTGLATFQWEIENRYGDSNYELYFPFWTSPADFTPSTLNNNALVCNQSIPGFLGYIQDTYPLASIYSDFTYAKNAEPLDALSIFQLLGQDQSFRSKMEKKNNYFTIYNHDESVLGTLDPDVPSTYYDKIVVTVNPPNPYDRNDMFKLTNDAIKKHPQLNPQYSGLFLEKTYFNNAYGNSAPFQDSSTRYRLTIQLNRFTTKNVINQKQTIIFPDESNNSPLRKVWTGNSSVFFFKESTALTPTLLNSTLAEIGTVDTNGQYFSKAFYTYDVTDSLRLKFDCLKYDPDDSRLTTPEEKEIARLYNEKHSFTINFGQINNVTLKTHLDYLNSTFKTQLVQLDIPDYGVDEKLKLFPETCRLFYYDIALSRVRFEVGFNHEFTNENYIIDATGTIFSTIFGLPPIMDLSVGMDETTKLTVYTNRFLKQPNGYVVNNQNREVKIIGKSGEIPVIFNVPYAPVSDTFIDNWYAYSSLSKFEKELNLHPFGYQSFQEYEHTYQYNAYGTKSNPSDTLRKTVPVFEIKLASCNVSFADDPTDPINYAIITVTWGITSEITEQDFSLTFDYSNDAAFIGDWTNKLGFDFGGRIYPLIEYTPLAAPAPIITAVNDVGVTVNLGGTNVVAAPTIQIYDTTTPGPNGTIKNNEIWIRPRANADAAVDTYIVTIDPGIYTVIELLTELNAAKQNIPVIKGTNFYKWGPDEEDIRIDWNINKVYRAQDYTLTFFDLYEFGHCQPGTTGNSSLTQIKWDQTLGWLLGYRNLIAYNMIKTVAQNADPSIGYASKNVYTVSADGTIVTLQGDTPVNVNIYNQLHVILDDYASNHMTDGIITVSAPDAITKTQSYANRAAQRCDTTTGLRRPGVLNTDPAATDAQGRTAPPLTQNQMYAALAQNQVKSAMSDNPHLLYSSAPNLKDMFSLIPLKLSGLQVGQSYTEFGGTLQQNNRKYFGPVDIFRIGLKLISDRGDVVDLNNNDWSIGIICDVSIQA